ncbi:MAG: HIT family protein [Candidatus Hodarchaeota archaeon]
MGENNDLKENALFKDNLQAIGKLVYIKNKKSDGKCIFCIIKDKGIDETTKKLFQDGDIFVVLNAYPYNPGHLMIVPNRHVAKFVDLSKDEVDKITDYLKRSQTLLKKELGCEGFNVGFNEGNFSGASISAHFHLHVVPRFKNELGFIDIIGKTRAVVYSLEEIYAKLKGKI